MEPPWGEDVCREQVCQMSIQKALAYPVVVALELVGVAGSYLATAGGAGRGGSRPGVAAAETDLQEGGGGNGTERDGKKPMAHYLTFYTLKKIQLFGLIH